MTIAWYQLLVTLGNETLLSPQKGKGSLIQPPPFVISYSQSLTVNS